MASSGKKRKREFQDENICAAQNFQSLQNKSDAKKRKVSIQSKQSARKVLQAIEFPSFNFGQITVA